MLKSHDQWRTYNDKKSPEKNSTRNFVDGDLISLYLKGGLGEEQKNEIAARLSSSKENVEDELTCFVDWDPLN